MDLNALHFIIYQVPKKYELCLDTWWIHVTIFVKSASHVPESDNTHKDNIYRHFKDILKKIHKSQGCVFKLMFSDNIYIFPKQWSTVSIKSLRMFRIMINIYNTLFLDILSIKWYNTDILLGYIINCSVLKFNSSFWTIRIYYLKINVVHFFVKIC